MKIAIVGAAGRMGRKLCELAADASMEVVSRVDAADGFDREWAGDVEGVVDLPQPEGPTRTRNSPSRTSSVKSSTAGRSTPS